MKDYSRTYIPSYAYGGYNNLPQHGLGSWLSDKASQFGNWVGENSQTILGGLTTAAGVGLSFTGVGAGIGVPMAASGLGMMGNGIAQNQQMNAQENQMGMQQDQFAQQQAMQLQQMQAQQQAQSEQMQQQQQAAASQSEQNRLAQVTQNRLSQYNTGQAQQGQQYNNVFKNGGYVSEPNRNNPQPNKTKEGRDYYIMRYNEAFANDPNVRDFTEGYSYTSDPNYAYKYGAMAPMGIQEDKPYYLSDKSGNTELFKKAALNGLSDSDLDQIKPINPRRSKDSDGNVISSYKNGGFMEGVNKNPNVTYFANGGTHEQSPLGGIPIGNKGRVEEGEFKAKIGNEEYIFSNRF